MVNALPYYYGFSPADLSLGESTGEVVGGANRGL